jgi:hypothetical protein
MPANIPGCGTENEPKCEPIGDFVISSPLTTSGYYTILDPDKTISDYIVFGNTGPNGNGEIFFYSDPNLLPVPPSGTNLGALCTEVASQLLPPVTGGCTGTFTLKTTSGTTFTVTAASDDEAPFDPFGFKFDSSDQIMFTGISTIVQTPPPTLTKAFADAELQLFGPSSDTSLSFTITNPSAAASTGIAFDDTLPSGLAVSTPNGVTGSCGGGSITAVAGSNSISLSGATLAPGASCTFSVNVTGTEIGVQTNTTSVISASGGTVVGVPATATTSVDDLFFNWFFSE